MLSAEHQLLASYEKTIQTAFQEVSDNLARNSTIEQQIVAYNNHVKSIRKSFDLASVMYDAGVKDYLSVLTARNSLYSAEKTELALFKKSLIIKLKFSKF